MTAETSTSLFSELRRRRLLDRLLDERLLDERLLVDRLRPVDEEADGVMGHSVEAWRAGRPNGSVP